MSSIDIIRMGLKNLYRRKGRTFLTVLGVIIGTAAIVTMISIGLGIKKTFIDQVKQFGSLTAINIYPSSGGGQQIQGSYVKSSGILSDKTVKDIERLQGVIAVIPSLVTDMKIASGKYVNTINIKGIEPEKMKYLELKIKKGRILAAGDEFELVFGSTIAMGFYNPLKRNNVSYGANAKPKVDIFNDKIIMTVDNSYGEPKSPYLNTDDSTTPTAPTAKVHKVKVVGLIKEGSYDNDYQVFMSMDEVKKLIREKTAFNKASTQGSSGAGGYGNNNNQTGYQNILVKVDDVSNVKDIQDKIKKMGYEAYSSIDSLKEVEKISNIIQLVLGGIAAISLFVASLGITNTMIMAIYERTREIGIMKVIGAQLADIKKMFLFEAALIGLLGGILGSSVSYLASFILNKVLASGLMGALGGGGASVDGSSGASSSTTISIIPVWLILFALVFTTCIGIVSGYYPAKRAMKLSAIEAIKSE